MAIVKMKRLRVIALAEQRDELLSRLLHVGCVEVTEPQAKLTDPEWTALLNRDNGEQGEMKAKATAMNAALSALNQYAPVKSGLLAIRTDVSERDFFDDARTEKTQTTARTINDCVTEISQLYTEENRLSSARDSLVPWQTMEEPLDINSTEHVEIMLGTVPAVVPLDEVKGSLAEQAPESELIEISSNKELHYLMFLTLKDKLGNAMDVLKPYGFSIVKFKGISGNAMQNMTQLDAQLSEVIQKREGAIESIKSFGDQRGELKLAFDRFNQEAEVEGVKDNGLTDGTIVFLEGWATVPKLDKLEKQLKALDCAYELSDPEEEDQIPTLLDNPKWMRGINMVTEMYSLPAYDGIDPNPLIFFWYVFFYGFVFSDVAYGLIILLASIMISKKYKPKNTVGYIVSLGKWLGGSSIFCGIFAGGFFSDSITMFSKTFLHIPQEQFPHWLQMFCNGIVINPVNDPMKVLIIALSLGCVQLIFGQCIHIYMEFRDGRPLAGILDVVPWWIFFAGIAELVLADSAVLILVSLAILILTQGWEKKGFLGKLFGGIASLYDVTSWLSNVLSYSRLMALMLAGSVIGMVFNTLATLPGLIIVFILVFVAGHAFNLGVSLIDTYVHDARLQYLEFFGRFYKEGGVAFKPLKYNTKFVDVIEEEK